MVTSKQIELESPGCSGFEGNSNTFPMIIFFFKARYETKTFTDFFTFALVPSSISFGFGAIVLADHKNAQICPIELAVAPDLGSG